MSNPEFTQGWETLKFQLTRFKGPFENPEHSTEIPEDSYLNIELSFNNKEKRIKKSFVSPEKQKA